MSIPECGKGTKCGPAADAAKYGFAPCTLSKDHGGPCDAGPVPHPVASPTTGGTVTTFPNSDDKYRLKIVAQLG